MGVANGPVKRGLLATPAQNLNDFHRSVGRGDDAQRDPTDDERLAGLRDALEVLEDDAGDGLVLVVFRHLDAELVVD
jgi:hypothetical protein